MTVFRGYLLIIKRNWGFIFIYTALFLLTMLIIQGETQKKEEKEFQRSRLKIAVVDEDGGMLANHRDRQCGGDSFGGNLLWGNF